MVYNFSLPPLLFDAYTQQDAEPLADWLRGLQPPPAGTTWFNFTASHDGIGVRPLEGLASAQRITQLVDATRKRGGEVSMRQLPCGELKPYELNITWRDAMRDPDGDDRHQVQRLLASQAFMLALQGVPAAYFHALVGTPNDLEGMRESGHARRINRRKFSANELRHLVQEDPIQSAVFDGYRKLLRIRREQAAFDPEAGQQMLETNNRAVVAFLRTSVDGTQSIIVAANFSDSTQNIVADWLGCEPVRDLIRGEPHQPGDGPLGLEPNQILWLETGV